MGVHDRHFYLYAKGWYATSSEPIFDLKRILGEYCGISPAKLMDSDLARKLIGLAYLHIRDNKHSVEDFIWKVFICHGRVGLLVEVCLGILGNVKISELGFDMGVPDPNILTLSERKESK